MTNGRGLSEESDSASRCGGTKIRAAGYPKWFLAVIKAHAHLRRTRMSGTNLYGVPVGCDGEDHRAAFRAHESPHHLANAVTTLNNHSRTQWGPERSADGQGYLTGQDSTALSRKRGP